MLAFTWYLHVMFIFITATIYIHFYLWLFLRPRKQIKNGTYILINPIYFHYPQHLHILCILIKPHKWKKNVEEEERMKHTVFERCWKNVHKKYWLWSAQYIGLFVWAVINHCSNWMWTVLSVDIETIKLDWKSFGIHCVPFDHALLLLLLIIRKFSSETESSCHSTFANLFLLVSECASARASVFVYFSG